MNNENISQRLFQAAENGHLDDLVYLLKHHTFVPAQLSYAVMDAAMYGHEQCLLQLLAHGADPTDFNSSALRLAASAGQLECVKILAPLCDPLFDSSAALRRACNLEHKELVDVLYPISNPQEALAYMIENNIPHEYLHNYMIAQERQTIEDNIDTTPHPLTIKKKI